MTDERVKKLWYIYTKEHYLAIKTHASDSVLMRWMSLEPVIQSKASQKERERQISHIRAIYGAQKDGTGDLSAGQQWRYGRREQPVDTAGGDAAGGVR